MEHPCNIEVHSLTKLKMLPSSRVMPTSINLYSLSRKPHQNQPPKDLENERYQLNAQPNTQKEHMTGYLQQSNKEYMFNDMTN